MSSLIIVKSKYKWKVKDYYTLNQFISKVTQWKDILMTRWDVCAKWLAFKKKKTIK